VRSGRTQIFYRGSRLKDVVVGRGIAGQRGAAWLDDRRRNQGIEGNGDARPYRNPLTATGLFLALKTPRFNNDNLDDAERRLIYINDLDPACIYALIATANWHEAKVLRNAIYKHLTLQASISVKIPSAGFLSFQLELHLPFFLLRTSKPPMEYVGQVNTKPRRQWTDLSFLNMDTCQEQEEVWGIHEAQISCVIAGYDEWRWVAYCFSDTEIDGFLADSSEDELRFDQIAAGEIDT
jgi:hypothetical protein